MYSFKRLCLCFSTILLTTLSLSAEEDTIRFIVERIIWEEEIRVTKCESLQPSYRVGKNQSVKAEIYGDATIIYDTEWSCYTDLVIIGLASPVNVTDTIFKAEIKNLNVGEKHATLSCYTFLKASVIECSTYIHVIDNNMTDVGSNNTTTRMQIFVRNTHAADKNHYIVRDVDYNDYSSLLAVCDCHDTGDYVYSKESCKWMLRGDNTTKQRTKRDGHTSIINDGPHFYQQSLDYSYDNKIISCYIQIRTTNVTWESGIRLKYRRKPLKGTTFILDVRNIIVIVVTIPMAMYLVTTSMYYMWTRFGAKMLIKGPENIYEKSSYSARYKMLIKGPENIYEKSSYSARYEESTNSDGSHEYMPMYDIVYEDRHILEQKLKAAEDSSDENNPTTRRPPPPPIETIPNIPSTSRPRLNTPASVPRLAVTEGSFIPESDLYLLQIDSDGYQIPDELKFIPLKLEKDANK